MRLLSFLPLLFTLPLLAQHTIGIPRIVNYSKMEFQAGTQTWKISQDKRGVLYFANNDGLLSYNGKYWKVYPLPNKTSVRSVAADTISGRIYVGAQDEMGYFYPDAAGILTYTSLKPLIPPGERQFADVWNIIINKEAVLFRGNDRIFYLESNRIRVYQAASKWTYLGSGGGKILAQDAEKGLLTFRKGSWETINAHFNGRHFLMTGILDYGRDTLLITTLKKGLFLLSGSAVIPKKTDADAALTGNHIFCAARVNADWFALGTTSGGICIVSRTGRVIQTLSRTEGLQNNNILGLFRDRDKNLWLGLDNGIDYVAYNSAVKYIYPEKNNPITGYVARIFNGDLFIGTSDGLYSTPLNGQEPDLSFSKGSFRLVSNTKGQVWNLSEVNHQLLLGHHEGASVIEHNKAVPLFQGTGAWLFFPLSSFSPSPEILCGTYNGLRLIRYSDGWQAGRDSIGGIKESLRFMAADNEGNIWSSHPYRGVYKIRLSGDKKTAVATLYTKKDGLPSTLDNYVYNIKNRIVTGTEKGVYEYDESSDRFVPSPLLQPVFKEAGVRYLKEDAEGNIWFVSNRQLGVVSFNGGGGSGKDSSFSLVYFPELTGRLVEGFEFVYPYNRKNIFVCAEKGIVHINYDKYIQSAPRLTVVLGQVKTTGKKDSLLTGGYFFNKKGLQQNDRIPKLPNSFNSFHFEYASPLYEQRENIEYSYQLRGFDKQWSEWTRKTEKDYTNLSQGIYTFMVKARNNLGNESPPLSYNFIIKPAWYQTIWAGAAYLVLLGFLLYLFRKVQQRKLARQQEKYEKEQRQLRYMHQLELEGSEREIVKLQNEKLENEINFKNKELATVTMHLVQRGKLLSRLKEELEKVLKNIQSPAYANEFRKLIRMLGDDEKSEEDWEQFAIHFDQVHSNFLTAIKAKHSNLSSSDLKLCAYLRMNLSSKEIAQLLNISLRGVEMSRYRLRKKLQVSSETNLFDYLISIGTESE